jgi:hypothetical protein
MSKVSPSTDTQISNPIARNSNNGMYEFLRQMNGGKIFVVRGLKMANKTTKIIIDSGASRIMIPNREDLDQFYYTPLDGEFALLGDDSPVPIAGTGHLRIDINGQHAEYIKDVLHVPNLSESLLSISHLLQNTRNVVSFTADHVFMYFPDTDRTIELGKQIDGLYYLNYNHKSNHANIIKTTIPRLLKTKSKTG